MKKKMIAMLLAGGQGSRLGVLTARVAKPAVRFAGRYRIIDFPLSNCVNSGVDTVGVLTQYRPLRLNSHIGTGTPWDLDRINGGLFVLPPYEKIGDNEWYTGTANAIYQNIEFMDGFNPDYVLILSGDHIYRMDYEQMLEHHISHGADLTIACMPVPWEEASRFGIMVTGENDKITMFEEKPAEPHGNLASMGIYIFSYPTLREALIKLRGVSSCDFGKHVIPYCLENEKVLTAYSFEDYWEDVGTLHTYWEANMKLLKEKPDFDLTDTVRKIYTKTNNLPPQYLGDNAKAENSLLSEGCEIYGTVKHSVLGPDVTIEEGAVVTDSVLMKNVVIRTGAVVNKAIISENTVVGEGALVGTGEYADSKLDKRVYNCDLVTVDEDTVIPPGVIIGRNTAISGVTEAEDYPDGKLESGGYIIKARA